MLKRAIQLITSLALISICHAAADARRIMELQKERHQVDSEVEVDVMLLVDRRGNQQTRELKRSFKLVGDGMHKATMVFTAPADIRGTALLIWEQEDGEGAQWLYLPAQGKMQRIASGSRRSYFMGTDFTYEDLEPEAIESFTYSVLREETVDGHECVVVQAEPGTPELARKSAYSKRLLWVRKDIHFTVKVEFYDRRDQLLKTQTNYELEKVSETAWRARKSMMDNHANQNKTLLAAKSRQINIPIDDSVFTERHFLSGKHLE